MVRPRFHLFTTILFVVLALVAPSAGWGAEATLTNPDGNPVEWDAWVADNAPVAVLLWASWEPDADGVLADLDRISKAARAKGFDLVVVAVQEPFKEAAESLDGSGVDWLHDRYGRLLKDYRVVTIPRLLVIADDGRVVEQLDVDSQALSAWGGE